MLEVPSVNVQVPNFKANDYQMPVSQMPMPQMGRDTFELMNAKKKADNNEKLMKAGIIAGIVAAAAMGGNFLLNALTHKKLTAAQLRALEEQAKAAKEQAAYFARQGLEKNEEVIKNIYEDISKSTKIEDMALSEDLKALIERLKFSVEHNDLVLERGGDSVNSILLYGPPGTGKTTFAKALAKMFPNAKFATLDVTKMKDKYVGETEKNINAIIDKICADADAAYTKYEEELGKVIGADVVKRGDDREIARAIAKARTEGKKIPEMERIFVFADEIDSVMMVDTGSGAKISNDMLNEFKKGFTEKLGKRKNIITVGATNLEIDATKAMCADGKQLDKPMLDRFGLKIKVDNPNKEQAKQKILSYYKDAGLVDDLLKTDSPELNELCQFIEDHGISFRQIESLLKRAGSKADTDAAAKVTMEDIVKTITDMKESLKISDDAEIEELINKLNITK